MTKKATFLLTLTLIIALLTGLSLTGYAFTAEQTHIIDNDDAQGYSNSRDGFDTWFQASNLYYQEARKQICDSVPHSYYYHFPRYSKYNTAIYGQVSAYLYNITFTDPSARYLISSCVSSAFASAGYINQDLAAPGWNLIGTAWNNLPTSTSSGGLYFTDSVRLDSSQGNPTKYCGADAIKIVLGY